MANIEWRSWSKSAFEDAAESGKPVLLAIGAKWCHWCHVMDEKTYSDQRVVDAINKSFIPVRVDADREPDINARYNMGGWPSTVFLTADRDVITGTTYVPPDQMLTVLERVSSAYSERVEEIKDKAKQARVDTEEAFRSAGRGTSRAEDIDKALDLLRSSYDAEHGGFGTSQKFPHPSALTFLLSVYESRGGEEDLLMATDTLDAMLAGEMFDPVEGGMYRYATRPDWTAPHTEKLLSENARMASVFLDAYRVAGKAEYLQAARSLFAYMEGNLMDPETGLFYGSQQASEQYYSADAETRKSLTAPPIDEAFYTDSNAILARAYLKLYGIGRVVDARDKALRIVSRLNHLGRSDCGTVPHYLEGGAVYAHGILSDSAELVLANVVCAEATGDDAYVRAAQELLESVFDAFGSDSGAFYDVSEARAEFRGLSRYSTPVEENAALALSFVKLADLTEDEAYRLSARRVLDALAGQFDNYGIMGCSYPTVLEVLNSTPLLVTIHADPGTEEADAFIQASLGACGANCTVRTVPAEGEQPAASVCLGPVCRIRVTDPEELAQSLSEVTAESMAESAFEPEA